MPLSPAEESELQTLVTLLRSATTGAVLSEYLKAKGLHYSGTRDDLEQKRIIPAVRDGSLSLGELKALLAEAEEFGNAHVFLYTTDASNFATIADQNRINAVANGLGLNDVLGTGLVLEMPSDPTIASIRIEDDGRGGKALVIKIIEKRLERKYLGEVVVDGNKLRKEWEIITVRAVSVARLFSFGLLEIRTASHWVSTNYAPALNRIRGMIEPFIPSQFFSLKSLAHEKSQLWAKRKDLANRIRFSSTTLKTDIGGRIDATAAGEDDEGDILADPAVTEGVDAFLRKGAYCDTANVFWLAQEDGLPSRETRMLLSGQSNEFAITSSCTKRDYEWIFDQLRAHSKPTSV